MVNLPPWASTMRCTLVGLAELLVNQAADHVTREQQVDRRRRGDATTLGNALA
jgi:hypothetical protein